VNCRRDDHDQDDTQLIGSYPHGRGTLPTSCLKPGPKPREGLGEWAGALLFVAFLGLVFLTCFLLWGLS
jgi:hypothetical protein